MKSKIITDFPSTDCQCRTFHKCFFFFPSPPLSFSVIQHFHCYFKFCVLLDASVISIITEDVRALYDRGRQRHRDGSRKNLKRTRYHTVLYNRSNRVLRSMTAILKMISLQRDRKIQKLFGKIIRLFLDFTWQ
jgi:hypothetical protein